VYESGLAEMQEFADNGIGTRPTEFLDHVGDNGPSLIPS